MKINFNFFNVYQSINYLPLKKLLIDFKVFGHLESIMIKLRALTNVVLFYFSERTNKDFTNDIKTDFNLEDLNFDPAAIIGDNNGDWNVSHV